MPGGDTYRHRAGIEGKHSQAVRTMGLRHRAILVCAKRIWAMWLQADAVNIIQLMSFLRGEVPEQLCISPFKQVMQHAA